MASTKLGVLADDLTGACDTALQFSKCGLETLVVKNPEGAAEIAGKVDVVVVDTESRGDAPEIAYSKVKAAASSLKKAGVGIFYKKIDSTLRGNIGSELDAILDELKFETAVISPAFPDNRRITVGGYHIVDGKPLQASRIGGGSEEGQAPIFIPDLIGKQTKLEIGHLNISKVRRGPTKLHREIENEVKDGKELIVVDAVTDADLLVIAKAVSKESSRWLPCGSAGLAESIPEAYGFIQSWGTIIISGSVSKVSMSQIAFTEKTLGTKIIKLNVDSALKECSVEVERICSEAKKLLSMGRDVVITSAATQLDVIGEGRNASVYGLSIDEVKRRIATALGESARKLVGFRKISGIVLTGGEVAVRTFEALGVEKLRINGEVLPGIPLTRVMDGEFRGLRVVTKAGAFGNEDALVKIIKFLRLR